MTSITINVLFLALRFAFHLFCPSLAEVTLIESGIAPNSTFDGREKVDFWNKYKYFQMDIILLFLQKDILRI